MNGAGPGTTVIVRDGTYTGPFAYTFGEDSSAPGVQIRPETPGGVTITGSDASILLTGSYLIWNGFQHKNLTMDRDVNMGNVLRLFGHHNRVTECFFYNNTALSGQTLQWIRLYPTDRPAYNRIDHCTLDANGVARGGQLIFATAGETRGSQQYLRIDHNIIRNMTECIGNTDMFMCIDHVVASNQFHLSGGRIIVSWGVSEWPGPDNIWEFKHPPVENLELRHTTFDTCTASPLIDTNFWKNKVDGDAIYNSAPEFAVNLDNGPGMADISWILTETDASVGADWDGHAPPPNDTTAPGTVAGLVVRLR